MTSMLAITDGYQGLWGGIELSFWSATLRMLQAVFAAAPFLVAGILIAGILRGMVGAVGLRRVFGVGHWSGPIRAWLIGVLMPICSLGALPIARELRRAGLPGGTVLSFVLVAPVLNPISILYGISQISLITLLYFALGTIIVSLGIGFLWNWLIEKSPSGTELEPDALPKSGLTRLAITGISATRGLIGPNLFDYGLTILAVGLMGAFVPYGALQAAITGDNVFATAIMSAIAVPAYVTPFEVMVQYGMIVRDGYSLGAAFALIVLGAGANVGVANWIRRDYGLGGVTLFVVLLLTTTMLLGGFADRALSPGATSVDHTHAFDMYARVSSLGGEQSQLKWLASTLAEKIDPTQVVGLVVFAAFALSGVALFLFARTTTAETIIQSARTEPVVNSEAPWQKPVSMPIVALSSATTLAGCIAAAVYIYFPPPKTLVAETAPIKSGLYDAMWAEDHDEISRRITDWESSIRKVPVAFYIRRGAVPPKVGNMVNDLLHAFSLMRGFNEHGEFERVKAMIAYLDKLDRECVGLVITMSP